MLHSAAGRFVLMTCLLLWTACAPEEARGPDADVRAVATTGIVADLVEAVGGERVEVDGLMGPGVDPHLYKASAGDVRLLARADVIFYNGLHLEAAMGEVLAEMQGRRHTVAVTSEMDRSLLLASPVYRDQYDPHVWFDVALWSTAIGTVRDALIEQDPEGAETYRANANEYALELQALDEWVEERVSEVPAELRVLITAHDAFRYFGERYGMEVLGLQGISTASEAGTGDVRRLVDFIVERRIPAIFVETSIPRRTIEAVRAAVRARGFDVSIGGSLYSDAMGDPRTSAGNYPGMVRHNVNTIVEALLVEEET